MFESLTPAQRIALIKHVNALVQADFETLVFALNAPRSVIPSESAAQGNRSSALLNWVRSPTGCGGEEFIEVLNDIAPLPFDISAASNSSEPASTKSASKTSANQSFQEKLPNDVLHDMVYIAGGRFYMGSPESEEGRQECEGPQHKVKVPSFFMGKYPVTQAQWYAVALLDDVDRDLQPNPSTFKGEDRPVECVSWHEAIEYCKRLSNYTGREYRLPSEAEWEYACRANTMTAYYFGDSVTGENIAENLNCRLDVNTFDGCDRMYGIETTDVGIYAANRFSLYDMHGNVCEWVQDCWHENYDNAPIDGSAWVICENMSKRIFRGGSWFDLPALCLSAFREMDSANYGDSILGVRVVCNVL